MLIKELVINQRIEGFFLVKRIEYRTARNDTNYVDITLSDTNKENVNGKIWRPDGLNIEDFPNGSLVKVRATVQKYKDKKQLIIEKIRRAKDSDGVNIEDYIETAPVDTDKMVERVYSYIDKISNLQIKQLTKRMFDIKRQKIEYYPAAKSNHHDIKGGLLYHILTMLRMGEMISSLYPIINTDLLFCGVILHDLAKVEEMEANNTGVVEDYSFKGKMLGHIIQGISEVERVADELDVEDEVKVLIQHMILSHHYEPEFGSPKKPLFPEAELLHYLDIIDARMYAMGKSLSKVTKGEFAERNFALENRSLYKHKLSSEEGAEK